LAEIYFLLLPAHDIAFLQP